jgi:ComF family protein
VKELASALAQGGAAALIPPRCAGCGTAGSWLCLECRDGTEPERKRVLGLPVRAAGLYAGPLRTAIHRYKYREEPGLAAELGGLVADLVAGDLATGTRIDTLVPVPLHPRRVRERGYDQTALLTLAVATRTGLPMFSPLHRILHARPQAELDRTERSRNVESAFVGIAGSLRGSAVALVDDVVTTGATVRAAARAARACGAGRVVVYAVAYDE